MFHHPAGAYRQTEKEFKKKRGTRNAMLVPGASREKIVDIIKDLLPDAERFTFFNDSAVINGNRYFYPSVTFETDVGLSNRPIYQDFKRAGLYFIAHNWKHEPGPARRRFTHHMFIDEKFMG